MNNEPIGAHRRMRWTKESWEQKRKESKRNRKRKLGEN